MNTPLFDQITESPEVIGRREALKRVALLMGGVVSAPVFLAALQGCGRSEPRLDWTPAFLSKEHAALVAEVAEIIIPKTSTPGAKDVGVRAFIDDMLKKALPEKDRLRFVTGMTQFADECRAKHGKPFLKLSAPQQLEYTKAVHDLAVQKEKSEETKSSERPFILMMKELTLIGFFTSEIGASEVLQYLPVPGAYRGCIPLSEAGNGKTWAT